MAASDVA
jgi:hypothetical protein